MTASRPGSNVAFLQLALNYADFHARYVLLATYISLAGLIQTCTHLCYISSTSNLMSSEIRLGLKAPPGYQLTPWVVHLPLVVLHLQSIVAIHFNVSRGKKMRWTHETTDDPRGRHHTLSASIFPHPGNQYGAGYRFLFYVDQPTAPDTRRANQSDQR